MSEASRLFTFEFRRQKGHTSMSVNHFHDTCELYYLLEGRRHYFVRDRVYTVQAGDLVLIDAQELHRTTDAGAPSHDRYLINFAPEALPLSRQEREYLLGAYKTGEPVLRLSIPEQERMEAMLYRMRQAGEGAGGETTRLCLLLEILLFCVRHTASRERCVEPEPSQQLVSMIARYINEAFDRQLTLNDVAGRFHISSFYLCKLLKRHTGFTFVEYLNNLRVKEARRLLRETDMSVLSVSEAVGFGSVSQFGRAFRSIAGLSPTHYRKHERQ